MLRFVALAALCSAASVLASPTSRYSRPLPRHTPSLSPRSSSLPYRRYRSVPVVPYHVSAAPAPYHPAPFHHNPAPPKAQAHGGEYRDPYHEDGPPALLCPGYPYCDDAPYLPHLQEEIEALRHRTALLQKVGENLVNQQPNRPFVGGLYY